MQGSIDFTGLLSGDIIGEGGTSVIANPSGSATDTLNKVQIDETIYSVEGGGGTEVIANPTGTATDELQTVEIDDVIYSISGEQQQADWTQTDTSAVDYIKHKPTIPPAQVNSDWNSSSGVSEILNKPTLSTVATSGSYNDLSNTPTIPDSADDISFNNTGTGMVATDVQDAITELKSNLTQLNGLNVVKRITTPASVVSFSDGSNLPMYKLLLSIEPVQEGSGDPSPENIRPISGHTEANVTRCGKNLFDLDAVMSFIKNGVVSTQGLTNQDGVITNSKSYGGDGLFPFNYPMTFSSNTITVSADIKLLGNHSSNNVFIQMFDSNGSNIIANGEVTMSSKDTWEHKTITLQLSLLTNVNLAIEARGTNNSVQIKNAQVEIGTTTTYEPYNGRTYNVQFKDGDNPLTVYGGTLDVVSGELKVVPYYASYNGETLEGEWISDRDVYAVGTTPTIGAQVVNIGATPQTYQLTPTQVKSLLGSNNVWADTGDILEVDYTAILNFS